MALGALGVTLKVLKRVRAARNDPFAKPLYESTNGQRFSALNHLFSGRLNFGLAISKIQVLAKLKAIGILGGNKPVRLQERAMKTPKLVSRSGCL